MTFVELSLGLFSCVTQDDGSTYEQGWFVVEGSVETVAAWYDARRVPACFSIHQFLLFMLTMLDEHTSASTTLAGAVGATCVVSMAARMATVSNGANWKRTPLLA